MTPLILSASCRFLRFSDPEMPEPEVPMFCVLISVSRPDGSFVTHLTKESFDFGFFPSGSDDSWGVGIEGLITTQFQNYATVPDMVAPGFYGLSLVFDRPATPYVPLLLVTVTETEVIPLGLHNVRDDVEIITAAQGQIVLGKIEDGADF